MPDRSRVSLVTAAAHGIGGVVAERLARVGHRGAVLEPDTTAHEPDAAAARWPLFVTDGGR